MEMMPGQEFWLWGNMGQLANCEQGGGRSTVLVVFFRPPCTVRDNALLCGKFFFKLKIIRYLSVSRIRFNVTG